MSDNNEIDDKKEREMTDKQKAFCREYVVDFNGSASAIRAGYSEDASRSIASELLTKPNIREEINRLQKETENGKWLERRLKTIEGIERIAFDVDEEIEESEDDTDEDEEKPRKHKSIATRDKLKALELMGKYTALFVDKVELSGKVTTGPTIDMSKIDAETKAKIAHAYAESIE